MDISKIINDSIVRSLKQAAGGKFDNGDDELARQNTMLMNYTNVLLETYHKELKQELAKHGIEI